jgi:hypothetical protein
MKTFITAQILAHLRTHPSATYEAIAKRYSLNSYSVQKAMRKLLDAGMVMGDIRKIEDSRGNTKDWRITPKGRSADKQNPLNSASKRYAPISGKTQAMSERLYRLREKDAEAAALRRKFSGPIVNEGEIQVEVLEPTKAGNTLTKVPKFFSAMPPGVYTLPPVSCAARAA